MNARWRATVMLTALATAGAVAVPRAQDAASVVSLDKVRTALERPKSGVKFEERKPDFTIEVVWQHPFHEIFDKPLWLLPKPGWQPPGNGLNLLSLYDKIAKATENARHERAEEAAREEVQRAIADFCAAQPDKTRAQICTTVVVVR